MRSLTLVGRLTIAVVSGRRAEIPGQAAIVGPQCHLVGLQ